MRVLSVVASSLSIAAGLVAFYMYLSMRVKLFRHHLILLLLMFDFGKGVVLLWYPARVLDVPSAYDNVNFCDIVGFLTSTFIQAADFAVLSLAIHTALLVFTRNSGPEGGLYRYRTWVYSAHVVVPLVMAGLVFINGGRRSFAPMVTWCYIPIKPLWAHVALSWAPRYVIIVAILSIYLAIYIYVKLEYRKVVKDFKMTQSSMVNNHSSNVDNAELAAHDYTSGILDSSDLEMQPQINHGSNFGDTDATPSFSEIALNKNKLSTVAENTHLHRSHRNKINSLFRRSYKKVYRSLLTFFSYFPGFGFLTPRRYDDDSDDEQDLDPTTVAIRAFQRESMANFQMRRNAIERQIRSIFVYPVAYIFLWMAPFAVHVLQYKTMTNHGGVFWISAVAAFMQPFNCVVDTIAFSIREKPWIDRREVIFTRENADHIRSKLSRVFPCFFSNPIPDEVSIKEELYDVGNLNDTHNTHVNNEHSAQVAIGSGNKVIHQNTGLSYSENKTYDNGTSSTTTHMLAHFSNDPTRKERQTSTGSDVSSSTDATYQHSNLPRPPTHPAAPNPGRRSMSPSSDPARIHFPTTAGAPYSHHYRRSPHGSPRSSSEFRRARSSSPHFPSFLRRGSPAAPSPLGRASDVSREPRDDNAFLNTTARRLDVGGRHHHPHNHDDDESEGEMDILQFLR